MINYQPATVDIRPILPESITKRDGSVVSFDTNKIAVAIQRCFYGMGKPVNQGRAEYLTTLVANAVGARYEQPTVEDVQDIVEMTLQSHGEYEAAQEYISYREAHAKIRNIRPIPQNVRSAFDESKQYFETPLQQFQFYDKYSRFNYELGRRETWVETVDRAVSYLQELASNYGNVMIGWEKIRSMILSMDVMPSMRLLAMAGEPARRSNICIYNCSYLPVDSIDAFVEALIISMSGCGTGFSVESKYVRRLPSIRWKSAVKTFHKIEDSSEGWADALRYGLEQWFIGNDVIFDYTEIRDAGAPLKIKGGRASGPEPLRKMLEFVRSKILSRQGSSLSPIDAHDIMCAIGNAAVSGGMRRTAMLSLFDFNDDEMLQSKSGNFEIKNNQRWNANNSAVWSDQLSQSDIMQFMMTMNDSKRGEPGIFNRIAANRLKPKRRSEAEFGCNPCGEIILRGVSGVSPDLDGGQFCNLSIAVARKDDTIDTLLTKVEAATIIGTIQSLATYFPGLRPGWKVNCEAERLLGVDITGQMDSVVAQDPQVQRQLRERAITVNMALSDGLGINRSASITCVKPSGNSSQLLDCSPGIHTRWAKFYIRNVRVSAHSPLFKVLKDVGVPMDPENGQTIESATTWVIHFPVKASNGAMTRRDVTALKQLNYWKQVKENWTEHNPSATITYQPDELLDITNWVWQNRETINGLTFLPSDDALYGQMPYVEITEEEYNKRVSEFPEIDFAKIYYYEDRDLTNAAQEVACMAGDSCEIDFVGRT